VEKALIRYTNNGHTRTVNVHADFSDGSKWALPGRSNSNTGYMLNGDGTVERQRFGTGRNEGECLSAEVLDATWEVIAG
jgi:hypothetical protein